MLKYKAYIKNGTKHTTILKRIIKEVEDIKYISEKSEIDADNKDPVRILYIEDGEGDLVEKCPGTALSKCCNYYVIKNIVNCPLKCSYCYLQTYINQPYITIYSNIDDIKSILIQKARQNTRFRIGTGEYSDSFALEKITGYTKELTEFFQDLNDLTIEFKTKCTEIEPYLNVSGNIIYGVTLEPDKIIEEEEKNTGSLEERILFLKKAVDKNNMVALHLDPIIITEDYPDQYRILIKKTSDVIDENYIAYISLGCMRFSKGLFRSLIGSFPGSSIIRGEFVLCKDSKYRYPREIRVNVFRKILGLLRDFFPQAPVYLCMEDYLVWNMVFYGYESYSHQLFNIK